MTFNLDELPHLSDIFQKLRGGKHLCADDGPLFIALNAHYERFAAFFKAIGFDLVKHERGFCYFQAEAELGKEASQLAVFFFVLMEAWGDAGKDVEETAFALSGHRCSELPHLSRESWRQCMAEAGIEDKNKMIGLIRRMERYGFTEWLDDDSFRFRTPAWRFFDLCNDIAKEAAAAAEEAARRASAERKADE